MTGRSNAQKQAAAVTFMAAMVDLEQEFVTKGILEPSDFATGLRLYANKVMARGTFKPFSMPPAAGPTMKVVRS